MTTQPRDAPPFEEPEPETKLEPLAMELHAAAMTDEQWSAFVNRARPGRS